MSKSLLALSIKETNFSLTITFLSLFEKNKPQPAGLALHDVARLARHSEESHVLPLDHVADGPAVARGRLRQLLGRRVVFREDAQAQRVEVRVEAEAAEGDLVDLEAPALSRGLRVF